MKYLVKFFVIILITFCFNTLKAENISIVYINMDKVMNETSAGKSLKDQLEKIHKENISEFHLDIWISLFNWIPLFILFITSQIYLKTASQRERFSKFLIAGTIPVLVSCELQAWFGVVGPFKIFNGLIFKIKHTRL